MIIAHGPVIMPVLLHRNLGAEVLSPIPLFLITIANAVRVLGNILKPLYPTLSLLIGYSGLLVLISVVSFFIMIMRAVRVAPAH